jgi:hypothetical protein
VSRRRAIRAGARSPVRRSGRSRPSGARAEVEPLPQRWRRCRRSVRSASVRRHARRTILTRAMATRAKRRARATSSTRILACHALREKPRGAVATLLPLRRRRRRRRRRSRKGRNGVARRRRPRASRASGCHASGWRCGSSSPSSTRPSSAAWCASGSGRRRRAARGCTDWRRWWRWRRTPRSHTRSARAVAPSGCSSSSASADASTR